MKPSAWQVYGARRRGLIKRFGRAQDGVAAIEFALVGLPFFLMMFAIIELAMLFLSTSVLEEAVSQASRTLLTGESHGIYGAGAGALPHGAGDPTEAFRREVCANVLALFDCRANLHVDVKSYDNAGAASGNTGSPVSGGALNTDSFGYQQPQAEKIVVVRAVLEYPVFVNAWNPGLANLTNGNRAILASTTFRAEPYPQS
jgi:pilus assembly protein Flp/PilA